MGQLDFNGGKVMFIDFMGIFSLVMGTVGLGRQIKNTGIIPGHGEGYAIAILITVTLIDSMFIFIGLKLLGVI